MKKTAIVVMIVTILVKIIGMIREVILSYYYGASVITDAYLISLTIPGTIFAFIGTAIATSYIPIYNEIVSKEDTVSAQKFTSNLISFVFIGCTMLILFFYFFPDFVISLFASGFNDEAKTIAISFTKIGLLSIYASALIYIFTSYLQIKRSFVPAIASGLIVSITAILFTFYSYNNGIIYLAIGNLVGIILQLFFLLPYIKKNNFNYVPQLKFKDPVVNKMLYLSMPVMIGVSVNQINVLINKTIVSRIAEGGISALTYADKLNLLIQGVFVLSIVTVFYPLISKFVVDGEIEKLKSTLSDVIVNVSLIIIPVSTVTIIFSQEIVELVYGRGAFNEQAIQLTSSALYFYSLGMIAIGLREVISRVFYAMQNTKTPMINAGIGMLINIVLSITLSKYLDIGGLALATSISAIITTIMLYVSLSKKIGSLNNKHLIISYIKIITSSVFIGLVAKLIYENLHNIIGNMISLFVSVAISFVLYLIMIILLRIREAQIIVNIIIAKLRNK